MPRLPRAIIICHKYMRLRQPELRVLQFQQFVRVSVKYGATDEWLVCGVPKLLIVLIRDQDQPLAVRRRAVEAVAPLSQPEVKKAITEAYLNPLLPLKVSALSAMGRNCDSTWLPILLPELRNPVVEIRYEAVGALGELGDETAIPHLVPPCYDEDVQVQEAAVRALGKIGGPEARLALRQCLQRADPRLRQTIQEALTQLESLEDPFEG